ncbi:PITM1 protein, partial [Centropus unirufus]|nr:PITM1 protein [Centropus unirufus]
SRYTCPFVEKFSIEIETFYRPDAGQQTNVFNLSAAEKRQRILDTIDIVRDPISPSEYKPEEDPKLYHSVKTGRGPLGDDWLEAAAGGPLMCAYKLCKVEFRYWGMQSKIEQFIHDVGLRKVMLRAHRQAWCWQDEWTDLTMEDIRQLEEETARMLAQKMAKCSEGEEPPTAGPSSEGRPEPGVASGQEEAQAQGGADASPDDTFAKQWSTSSRSSYSSQHGGGVSPQSLSEWRIQNIARDSENSSEEEFFDAHEDLSDSDDVFAKEITKWSSNDFLDTLERPAELEEALGESFPEVRVPLIPPLRCPLARVPMAALSFLQGSSAESAAQACRIHALFLILHSGNILDQGAGEPGSKQADVQTLAATFDAVTRIHFPEALGHVALRLVPCPPICAAAYALVSKTRGGGLRCPRAEDSGALPFLTLGTFHPQVVLLGDCVGSILGFDALCQSRAGAGGSRSSSRRGSLSTEPVSPELCAARDPLADGADGAAGSGQASPEPGTQPGREQGESHHPSSSGSSPPSSSSSGLTGCSFGSRLVGAGSAIPPRAHQPCCASLQASEVLLEAEVPRSGTAALDGAEGTSTRLDFKVSGFFLFGSPLGLVLALRKTVMPSLDGEDPCQARCQPPTLPVQLEPFVPKRPHSSLSAAEALQTHSALFLPEVDVAAPPTPTSSFGGFWRGNELGEPPTPASTSEVVKILERWWGPKRIDYSLYCPDALTAFPTITLPHLFHASYWESSDVVAFILRQVMEKEGPQPAESEESSIYSPAIPREKWQRKRTQVKIRNLTANHRACDVIISEGKAQVLSGRFMYGPLDVVTLTGEKVDIYIMTQPLSGKWLHYGTEVTSGSGRLAFTIPPDKALAIGIYPVRMVVRGDHSYAEAYLTVVARGTESVVFSIDGSFTASVSIMGSDPKVRAGAVDVVRHWQDSGYMIIYVTGRPDMQKHRVVAWLSQHNFPHGAVSFCDGLTHDPLRQKAAFLQSLLTEVGTGTRRDISVYSSLGLPPANIYIVGRVVKKLQNQCQFLSEGYVAHLAQLEAVTLANSPKGPPRPVLGKGTYGCPAPVDFLRKQSQLLRSRGSSQAERDGGSAAPPRAKPRSVSLKLEGEE